MNEYGFPYKITNDLYETTVSYMNFMVTFSIQFKNDLQEEVPYFITLQWRGDWNTQFLFHNPIQTPENLKSILNYYNVTLKEFGRLYLFIKNSEQQEYIIQNIIG